MPFDLREIAAISGMSGLYRLVKPTRNGVIIESLEENPQRSVAQARHKVSLLHEISIYTTSADEDTVPLAEVFDRVYEKFGENIPVTARSSNDDLKMFMEEVLPDYDRDRVYVSDMKKLVTWYEVVSKHVPQTEASEEENTEEAPAEAQPKSEE